MKKFPDDNFLLENTTAEYLFHEHAKKMPVIDYHCHLPPDQIANDINFKNLTQAWLYGDHYKWRAMRANGVDESFITGQRSDEEKFQAWADTVPFTLRNPLYHWTHLELQRYFGIYDILNQKTASKIYQQCSAQLSTKEFSVRNLLRKMNVKIVCTTDDPVDTLEYHRQTAEDGFEIKMFPAFRPDKAMMVDNAASFNEYVNKLEAVSNISITDFPSYTNSLKQRHDHFALRGCTVADHGLEQIDAEEYTTAEVHAIFNKIRAGKELIKEEKAKFRSALLFEMALWHWEKGWVQQFHLGPLRNNNSRMLKTLGPDTGWDSIGDFPQGRSMSRFFDRLDAENRLAKTIIYNVNPSQNELFAAMAGNYNDGSTPGKVQFGSAWWFLDQKDGMIKQINALSNMGLISRFVGMLTDSRSFLSFPRHEYFRRVLCNLFGTEVENGELPNDLAWIGKIIEDICYNNARDYFGWNKILETPSNT